MHWFVKGIPKSTLVACLAVRPAAKAADYVCDQACNMQWLAPSCILAQYLICLEKTPFDGCAGSLFAREQTLLQCKAQLVWVSTTKPNCGKYEVSCLCQVCGQQGLTQGLDQGGALGPADMVALAAAYPLLFIQVTSLSSPCCHQTGSGNGVQMKA